MGQKPSTPKKVGQGGSGRDQIKKGPRPESRRPTPLGDGIPSRLPLLSASTVSVQGTSLPSGTPTVPTIIAQPITAQSTLSAALISENSPADSLLKTYKRHLKNH
jgi:hypothetical protein